MRNFIWGIFIAIIIFVMFSLFIGAMEFNVSVDFSNNSAAEQIKSLFERSN